MRASSGDIVGTTPKEQKERFYLFVYRGRRDPSRLGARSRRGSGRQPQVTDFGIGNHLPAAASRHPRLAVIELS